MNVSWVITGASSQLGGPLLAQLAQRDLRITALTRHVPHSTMAGAVHWQYANLERPSALDASTQVLIHLAPIHLLPALLRATANEVAARLRIIAISTCSIRFKAQSTCPQEQQVAAQLLAAEQQVMQLAQKYGYQLTVLRPSMLYGAGRDGTVSVLQACIRRFGFLVLPAQAGGLRQPVHVLDVVQAIVACLDEPRTLGQCYELGGAECLTLAQLAERIFIQNNRRVRIFTVPQWLLRSLITVIRWTRLRADWRPGLVARAQQAQTVDNDPAKRDFAYAPRLFDGRFVVGTCHVAD